MSKGQTPMWERIVEQETRGQVHEAEMTDAEMKERERLVKGMKKSADDFETRYPGRGKEVMYATATKKAMEEAAPRPVQVGDDVQVHAAAPASLGWRGDIYISGRVVKIDGNWVHLKQANSNAILKVPMNKVSLQEAESDSDYETYFRAMLKKHGYDSPTDIPDDKKDDFFNAVDKGYSAKNESRLAEASARPVRVGDYVHAGFAVKGGAGFSGRVDKVDGNWVYVNVGKDKSVRFTDDPSSNWGERIIKAPMKNVSLQSESRLAEAPESILKPGTRVKVPHRGKMVSGKVVRYDNGYPYFSPYYMVDVGELSSVLVPAHVIKESRLAEATNPPTFTVVAIADDPTPEWKRRPGSPSQKVVWQMWGLEKKETPIAAKLARQKHPEAVIEVENAAGTVVKVYKPGQAITEKRLREAVTDEMPANAGVGLPKQWLVKAHRQNQQNDNHTGNAFLLIRLFGTPQEILLVQKLADIREKEGFIDPQRYKNILQRVEMLHSKYYRAMMSLKESVDASSAQPSADESDDLGMMKGQLKSLIDRAQALHDHVNANPPSNVEAWVQAKVTDADTAITALHDYFKYSDDQNSEFAVEPLAEAELLVKGEKPISGVTLPLKKTAALAFASAFVDRPAGATPEAIVNQALAVYFQKNKVPNIVRLRNLGRMLQLVSKMGINWNKELIPPQLVRFVNAAVSPTGLPMDESYKTAAQVVRGIKEAVQGPKAPSDMSATQRLSQQQKQEKEQLAARHQQQKMAAQQRDFQEKQRKQKTAPSR